MAILKAMAGRGAAVGAMLGLVYAGVLVMQDAAASILAVPALQLMEEWQQARYAAQAAAVAEAGEVAREEIPFTPDPADWALARDALERALALAPGNPELHANLGRLHQFRFEDSTLQLDEIRDGAELALASFRQAAQLRPTWPYHWWDIARTEYVLQRTFSPDFYQALDNSTRFGPWLEDVQLFAADLALEHWSALEPESRMLALANIDRALSRNPDIATSIVASYQAWEPLCDASQKAGQAYAQLAGFCASPELRSANLLRENPDSKSQTPAPR